MAVRLGKIELPGAQNLYTEEARVLVEQRVPEQQGSVFQDMGREPVSLMLEGLLLGEQAFDQMEKLRDAQSKAKPLSFAADIVIGSELTDVVIEDFQVKQVAGHANRVRFRMRLREYLEEPQRAGANNKAVNDAAKKDAQNWGENEAANADVLNDPSKLSDSLANNPELLDSMDMDEIGSSVSKNMNKLSGEQLGGMLESVADLNPKKAASLLDGIKKSGGLGSFINKIVALGKDSYNKIKDIMKKIDFSALKDLAIMFVKGGMQLYKDIIAVKDSAVTLWEKAKDIKKIDNEIKTVMSLPDKSQVCESSLGRFIKTLNNLTSNLNQLLKNEELKKLPSVITKLNMTKAYNIVIESLLSAIGFICKFVEKLLFIDIVVAIFGVMNPVVSSLRTLTHFDNTGVDLVDDQVKAIEPIIKSTDETIKMTSDGFSFAINKSEEFLTMLGFNQLPNLHKEMLLFLEALQNYKAVPMVEKATA